MAIGGTIRRFLGDGLGARVDHAIADRRVLGPERHQAPTQRDELLIALLGSRIAAMSCVGAML